MLKSLTFRLAAMFVMIAVAAIVLSIIAVRQVGVTAEQHAAVSHTYSVRGTVRRFWSAVSTAEAAARSGPAHEGKAAERFSEALKDAEKALAEFRVLAADNPVQKKAADELSGLLILFSSELRRASAEGAGAATAVSPFDFAMELQTRISAISEEALAEEARLLRLRSGAVTLSVTQSRALFVGGTVLAVLALGAAFLLVTRELRRRQASEASLAHQTEILSATFASMNQGIVVLAPDLRVLAANPWARTALSLPDDIVAKGGTFEDMLRIEVQKGGMSEADLDRRVAHVRAVVAAGNGERSEYTLTDGRVVEIDRRPYPSGGVVSTYSDITERRRIERLKNEFISTVSHELRTPLTSIRGSLGLVVGGAVGEVAPKAREMIAIAHTNSERLVRIINDILDIEKIESGRMQFDLRSLRLHDLVEQAIAANASYLAQYDVRAEFSDQADGAYVRVDPDRLMQVFNNLLSNAAKFSPRGSIVSVSAMRRNGSVRLSVADRGPGIPEEFRARIFGKFEQAESGDARRKGGTGLGLSIVKAIVEGLGGTVSFDSRIGEGTVFHVDLPELERIEPAALAATITSNSERPRILVVEDDRDVAHLLMLMLEQNGWSVTVAHSAKEAAEALSATSFAAMTLDVMLPDEDGLTFFRRLRSAETTRELPVVVVSAKAAMAQRELNGDAIGIVDWLEKPIDAMRLGTAMRRAVGLQAGPARILHVEDDADIVRVVEAVMGAEAEMVPAGTLAAARARLRQGSYALIVIDVGLPDGSGLDLLADIRLLDPPPPVVIFSAGDVDLDKTSDVAASLVKSRTDNEALRDTIHGLIQRLTC